MRMAPENHKILKLVDSVWCGAFAGPTAPFAGQIQEFAGEDTSDLFLEEREASLRQAQEEKHKIQMSVPGILNPHEIPEEMCD